MAGQIYSALRPGDVIVVTFGSRGTQFAVVHRGPALGSLVKVRKWRAKSNKWTQPVAIGSGEVVRRATQVEAAKLPTVR